METGKCEYLIRTFFNKKKHGFWNELLKNKYECPSHLLNWRGYFIINIYTFKHENHNHHVVKLCVPRISTNEELFEGVRSQSENTASKNEALDLTRYFFAEIHIFTKQKGYFYVPLNYY